MRFYLGIQDLLQKEKANAIAIDCFAALLEGLMPAFISDPVFDVSRNEVIHAHCVAATKMKGINGPNSPYFVRDHLETSESATLRVLMRGHRSHQERPRLPDPDSHAGRRR